MSFFLLLPLTKMSTSLGWHLQYKFIQLAHLPSPAPAPVIKPFMGEYLTLSYTQREDVLTELTNSFRKCVLLEILQNVW